MMHCLCQSNDLIIAKNATGATSNMLDKLKTESLTDSQVLFYVKHQSTVARHFASHQDTVNHRMTAHILEYIKTLKDTPR